jgi:hypothetical protein
VLEAEPALSAAVALMSDVRRRLTAGQLTEDEARGLRHELLTARAAIGRSAALGTAIDDWIRGRGYATETYDATGSGVLPERRPSFDQRV